MNQLSYPILSTVIFLPIFGALLILITRRSRESLAKWIALYKHRDIFRLFAVVHEFR